MKRLSLGLLIAIACLQVEAGAIGVIVDIPEKAEISQDYEVYTCHLCHRSYRRFLDIPMCAVNHAPGDCCHYGEELLTEIVLTEIKIKSDSWGISCEDGRARLVNFTKGEKFESPDWMWSFTMRRWWTCNEPD